ncbi:MAG: hypothetical protein AB1758_06295, partial [Candidatus Eremiobacterota bacterium]
TPRKQTVRSQRVAEEQPQPWVRLEVHHGIGWGRVRGLLRRTLRKQEPEVAVLMERCRLAPLELTLNGQSLPRLVGWEESPALVASYRTAGEKRPGCEITLGKLQALRTVTGSSRGPFSLVMTVGGGAPSETVFVHHGLTFRRPDLRLGPGVRALVFAPELKKDLSHTALVEDDTFKLLQESLRLEMFELFGELEPMLPELPAERRPEALACLDWLVGFRLQHGDLPGALRLATRVADAREGKPSVELALSQYMLAHIDRELGRPKLARKRLEEAMQALAACFGVTFRTNHTTGREDSYVSFVTFEGARDEEAYLAMAAAEQILFGPRHDLFIERLRFLRQFYSFRNPARSREYDALVNADLVDGQLLPQLASQARYVGKKDLPKVSLG